MTKIAIPQGFKVTPQQFEQLANYEQEARLELTASGELVIMSPTGGTAVRKNFRLIQQLAKEIYRQGKSPEILNNPKSISGEDILSGFVLNLSDIFS